MMNTIVHNSTEYLKEEASSEGNRITYNLSEDKFNKVEKDRKKIDKDVQESDLEALTKSFAEMKIQ